MIMTLIRLLLYSQIYISFANVSPSNADQYRIAYHVLCNGDRLVKLSSNIMKGETEAYPDYVEIIDPDREAQHHEARFLSRICANENFKDQLKEYPLLPSLQHGYLMFDLNERINMYDLYNQAQPVIEKIY